jgi:hypothetical protein
MYGMALVGIEGVSGVISVSKAAQLRKMAAWRSAMAACGGAALGE